ncbi:MAG TPA: amino acid adenylation domain-containing protein [Pyrinomonadaceae bacterium]|nr:amino acid adenylation domain-containing protein [Pyrinomonadaceae bacterium]
MRELNHRNSTSTPLPAMTDARRSLLEKYLQGAPVVASGTSLTISRRSPDSPARVSFSQERLWVIDQLLGSSAVFNVPMAVRISAPIDDEVLERSINEVIRRHEVLRTTFAGTCGVPVPTIAAELRIRLRVNDLSNLSPSESEARARVLSHEEAEEPFDLVKGPLIRAGLIRLNSSNHLLIITLHHICSDGWSLVLLFEELAQIYDAFRHGQPSPLSELPIQYADYATWQREWLQGERLDKQLGYWKEKLGGELPILDLPTDRPRPALQTYPGARVSMSASEELTDSLNLLSRREGVTLFMTLLAAFKTLLYRHTGQNDIVVGSPIANRPQTETEFLIGFFLNNLALRTDLGGNPTFRDLLARVRRTALDAYANQDVPFEKLIEELKPERDLSRTTIFQVYFNLFNFADEVKCPGMNGKGVSFYEAWSQSEENLSKFDLTLYAGIDQGRLRLAFVYNTDLFDETSIRLMLEQYRALLEQVTANADVSIARLPLVVSHLDCKPVRPRKEFIKFERAEIEQSITDRFATQVRRYANRTAIKTSNHEWTYRQLNDAANRVARALLSNPTRQSKVALLFQHDAPMIAGMLGTLKAGKVYVPLDPAYPQDRLLQILKNSQADAIITDARNAKLAAALANKNLQLINFDRLDGNPVEEINVPTEPQALAYLLYTSGSTGEPKGVMQNHRNVLHFIRAYTNNLGLDANDRLTLLSSYCFDASVMDIYGALLNGATLYPVDIKEEGLAGLTDCLSRDKITLYHSTPTVYRHFINTLDEQASSSLRLIVLGGEPVNRADVDLYKRHFADNCWMVNGLGPTESTVTLQYFIDQQTHVTGQGVPVGYAVDDTVALLLDDEGKPTDISGEIAIKCEHVALGYWRNESATAAAFSGDGSNRMYRTGDMGRRLPDGAILFTGRKDSQVKIRGFRVELSEIETTLARHPAVRETVAVLKNTKSGDKQLVAYVVLNSRDKDEKIDLRSYLKARLPEYMVPAAMVVLDELPLTASGKLNRLALPEPVTPSTQKRGFKLPGRAGIEQVLAMIWADVLGLKVVGPDENFFELGGHSLLAVVLFARIVKYFGKRLPVATLFQAPTVSQLAAIIESSGTPVWSALVPIQPTGPNPPFFCVHAKGGNVLEFYDLANHLGTDQPFYGLQSRGLDQQTDPHTSVVEMATHYVREIRTVQPRGPYYLGGRSLGGTIAFEMASQLKAAGEEVSLLALLDTYPAGYLKLLPETDTQRTKLNRGREWFACHRRNLNSLSLPGRVKYVAEKTRFVPARVKTFFWRKAFRLLANLGRPLPRILRDVTEFNSMAVAEYTPRPYAGPITLFWASEDRRATFDLVEGWRVLAENGIEVHEISGSHLNLIKEPHVGELAVKLKACLTKAHEPYSRMQKVS